MHEKRDSIYGEIQGRLVEPDLVNVHHKEIGGAADVRSSYHPHGVGDLPRAPSRARGDAAADVIASGRTELEATRAAAEAMRGQRVRGSVDLQSEINVDQDHTFFRDPKLRE